MGSLYGAYLGGTERGGRGCGLCGVSADFVVCADDGGAMLAGWHFCGVVCFVGVV